MHKGYKMYESNPFKIAAILPLLLLAVVMTTIDSSAHGDEHKESSDSQADSVTVEQIPLRDSIYAEINKSYLKIKPIFKERCFDCHSKATNYPWYHSLPVVGPFLDDHIKHGLEHIDFSNDFPFKSKNNLLEILGKLREEIEENEMPIMSYRLLHWGKTIDGVQQDSVFNWIDQTVAVLKQFQGTVTTEPEQSENDSGQIAD